MKNKTKAKILVIEDEKGIRNFLSYELTQSGYSVQVACDGEEGIEKIKHGRYDIVISDIMMPKLNGLETLKIIKSISSDTEVIMITGYATVENALQCIKDGAYGFIQKPFNLQELIALIEKALEKNELKTLIAIYESSQAIFSKLKLEELLPLMIKQIRDVVNADEVGLLLNDHQDQLYLGAASFPLTNYLLRESYIAIANHLNSSERAHKAPLIINIDNDKDSFLSGIKINPETKSLILVPITLRNKKYGVLLASRKIDSEPFNQTDSRNLSIFVSQMAQSIANTKLFEQLEAKISELEHARSQLGSKGDAENIDYDIAGELENSLSNILNFADDILDSAKLPVEVKRHIDKIKKEAENSKEKIEKLFNESR